MGRRGRAAGCSSGLGGGDGSKGRSGSSCVASRRRGGGSRRGGRAGAGAVGRPRTGARRTRRGGGIPAACGRVDRRSRAASRQGARRRPGQLGGRRVRRGTWAARGSGGGAAGRTPARPPGPAARRGRLLREPRKRSSGAAPARRQGAGAPRSQLARETYLDAWSSALFAGQLATTTNLHDVSRETRTPVRDSASVGSTSGRLCARVHEGRSKRLQSSAGRRPPLRGTTSRPRRCCAGGGSPPRPR